MTCRVAMVGACPYPVPQGSQTLLRDTALGLRAQGHVVHLVVYGYGLGDDESGLPVHRAARVPGAGKTAAGPSLAKPLLDLALVRTLRRVVREEHIRVVHAHNYEGLLVALLAGKRPIVYHAHNAMADELPYYLGWKGAAQRFGSWLDRALPRRAGHVIAPHPRLADYLARCGCAQERITVVPPPVDASVFDMGATADELPPVVYTGNLDSYQNLELLEGAMALVRQQEPDARLIIGTHQSKPVRGAEFVAVENFEALRGLLGRDVVVACPRVSWSGYPIKLLNAMAAGKAVVACESAAQGLSHEETGLIVPDNDAEAFATALLRLMRDAVLRERLGTAARAWVQQQCAPDKVASAIERVYAGLDL